MERHRTVNTILKKKVGGPTLADLKPYYYRTTVIKQCGAGKRIDRSRTRRESPIIDLQKSSEFDL